MRPAQRVSRCSATSVSAIWKSDVHATAAARRAGESLARDIWRQAADLAALDRDVAQRITASSGEIHGLSFGPGLDGPKETPPTTRWGCAMPEMFTMSSIRCRRASNRTCGSFRTKAGIRVLYEYLTAKTASPHRRQHIRDGAPARGQDTDQPPGEKHIAWNDYRHQVPR